jgi:hypothetical protein
MPHANMKWNGIMSLKMVKTYVEDCITEPKSLVLTSMPLLPKCVHVRMHAHTHIHQRGWTDVLPPLLSNI